MSNATKKNTSDYQKCLTQKNLKPFSYSVRRSHPSGKAADVDLDGLFYSLESILMPKDAYYFPHDSNAQHDEKILQLRANHGWQGYGLYWAVIERLRDNEDYKFSKSAIPGLSLSLSHPQAELQALLDDCINIGLLVIEDGCFFSPSLTRRMKEIDSKREILREAGRRGGLASSQAKATLKHPSSSKVKESKVNIYPKGFDGFWLAYPRKENKPSALKAFSKINPDDSTLEAMLKSIAGSKKTEGWLQENGKYIPLPASWLNGRRWEDVVTRPVERPISFRAD